MIIKPITLEPLFYLYCALIYTDNKTIRLPQPQLQVAEEIKKILEKNNIKKIEMDDHRYQYLLTILGTTDYQINEYTKQGHEPVLEYVKSLTQIEDLKPLWEKEKAQVEEHLSMYGDAFINVQELLNNTFDIKLKFETIYVTRNFGKSGMLIPLKTEAYLILGNISYKPNIRNLIHELTHAYLEEVNLKSTPIIKDVINKLPNEVYDNYKRPYVVMEDSMVRALVVYLTDKSELFQKEDLSEQDKELVLTEKYLDKLYQDNPTKLTKEYLENIEL